MNVVLQVRSATVTVTRTATRTAIWTVTLTVIGLRLGLRLGLTKSCCDRVPAVTATVVTVTLATVWPCCGCVTVRLSSTGCD
eukprot:1188349-Prorocentrum_minimum.AAC.1